MALRAERARRRIEEEPSNGSARGESIRYSQISREEWRYHHFAISQNRAEHVLAMLILAALLLWLDPG
jgi:hypothetical protein